MTRHYSEAELLETWYTKPGESMPVMMHLADCAECAERWERLDRKLRGLGACPHSESRSPRRTPWWLIAAAIVTAVVVAVFTCSGPG